MSQLIEVRVLGLFQVRCADGQLVDPRAWRTAKTRDLVRLLAVAGRPVAAERIIDVLWPGAEPARGRGSLRTAASQARRVLGAGSVVRHGGSLELAGVWVDAAAFASRAGTARHMLAEGDVVGGLAAAWEAVVLYSGDVCEDESYADWVVDERDRLRRLLRQLVLDAGEGACTVGWWRDAVELGHQALDLDACAERAYRVLMRAYSALGETEQALRTFERCRRTLADQLGADPDAQTRALHLQLLRPQEPRVPTVPFIARGPVLAQVRATMEEVVDESRPRAVVVTGPTGIGRTRLLREAAAAWSHRCVVLPCRSSAAVAGGLAGELARALGGGPEGARPAAEDLRRLLGTEPVLLVLDDVQEADADSLAVLGRLLRDESRPLLVLAATPEAPTSGHPLDAASCTSLELPAFAREDVAELLTHVLQGPPSRSLVEELAASSDGRPSALLDAARALLGSGQLLSTTDGMVRVPPPSGGGRAPAARPLLATARERVGADGAAVLDLLAVLDRPTTLAELCRIGDLDRAAAQLALDQLCDLQPVVRRPTGYALADALVREAAYRWLRPSASRDLHRRVAELAYLPPAVRVEHWLAAGEPALACAAALEAADEALAIGDDVQLRAQLRTVRAFAEQHATDVEGNVLLCERLAEVASRLGRRWEAQELLERAVALARSGAPGALPRLRRALGRCTPSTHHALQQHAAAAGGPHPGERRRSVRGTAAASSAQAPRRAADLLARTVLSADDDGDVASQVEARILLARAAEQRRDFDRAERSAKEAMVLAEAAHDDALFLRAVLALTQTPALLGDGLRQLELLRRARDLSGAGGAAAAGELALTWCLVLHDLDHVDFERAWRRTSASERDTGNGRLFPLLGAHVCLDRDRPRQARRQLDQLPEPIGSTVVDDAARILRARLLVLEGDLDGAERSLSSVLVERPSGPGLLAPEAGARLAALLATRDLAAARMHLEQARTLTREHAFPRERLLMLRASAEVLCAEGHPSGAATVALAAAMTAHRAGLVLQEAEGRARHQSLRTAARSRRHPGAGTIITSLPRQPRALRSPEEHRS